MQGTPRFENWPHFTSGHFIQGCLAAVQSTITPSFYRLLENAVTRVVSGWRVTRAQPVLLPQLRSSGDSRLNYSVPRNSNACLHNTPVADLQKRALCLSLRHVTLSNRIFKEEQSG